MTQDSPEFNELALPLKAELRTYTLRKVLGWGSFGITYLAHDHSLDVDVVIKENLPKEYATRKPGSYEVVPFSQRKDDFKWAKDRFIQEARTLAKLNHPNIMRVMSIFEELGTAYYVMPYVGGRSLDKVLNQEGPLPEEQLRPMLCSLLKALDYLHRKNLLHRDIKPDNILLDNEGKPILIDFGTARQLSKAPGTVPLGTLVYAPFEQTQTNGKLGPYSDIYSLGGTMYTLITGKKPEPSTDRVGNDPDPQPRLADDAELRRRFSHDFLVSIDKALSVEKDNRWQTAEEWMKALTPAPTPNPVSGETSPSWAKRLRQKTSTWMKSLKSVLAQLSWRKAATFLIVLTGVILLFVAILSYEGDERPPLIKATAENRVEAVQNLLNRGEPLEVKDSNGNTPLLIAAGEGFEAIARLLLQKGANTEAQDANDNTPLILASEKGHKSIVQLLLDRGANMEAQDANGNTPLIHASEKGHKSIVQSLLDRGANTGRKNKAGKTAYMVAQDDSIRQLFPEYKVHEEIKNRLINSTKEEILIKAVQNGETDLVELLIDEYGVSTEVKSSDNSTPLLWAAFCGNEPLLRSLLQRGARLDEADFSGYTPLMWAAKRKYESIVRLLLEKGANTEARNKSGQTAYDLAKSESIKQLLRSHQR